MDNLTIRRLDPAADRELYRQAWQWTQDAPQWFRDCAKVFEVADETAYLAAATDPARVDIGIWTPEFTGMISVVMRATQIYEAYLAAKRGSSTEAFGLAIADVANTLARHGMLQTFVWIAARNRAILSLCEGAGFELTGLEMYKGSSHGRPIRWRQMNYVPSHQI